MAQDQWTLQVKGKSQKSKTGARAATADLCCSCQQDSTCSLQTVDPGAHGMNRGQSKIGRRQTDDGGSGHGMAKVAGKQSRQNKAAAGNTAGGRSDRYRPRSKTTASRRHWPASRRAVQVGEGSAVVLATRKVGSDLPYLSPSHLSPLPVSVNTHSLNL